MIFTNEKGPPEGGTTNNGTTNNGTTNGTTNRRGFGGLAHLRYTFVGEARFIVAEAKIQQDGFRGKGRG